VAAEARARQEAQAPSDDRKLEDLLSFIGAEPPGYISSCTHFPYGLPQNITHQCSPYVMHFSAALQSTGPFLLECMTLLFLPTHRIAPLIRHNATASGHISGMMTVISL